MIACMIDASGFCLSWLPIVGATLAFLPGAAREFRYRTRIAVPFTRRGRRGAGR